MLQIFADGSVSGNGKPDAVAGYGTVFAFNGEVVYGFNGYLAPNKYPPYQSNNTGELGGVLAALRLVRSIDKPLSFEIVSDSEYAIETMRKK